MLPAVASSAEGTLTRYMFDHEILLRPLKLHSRPVTHFSDHLRGTVPRKGLSENAILGHAHVHRFRIHSGEVQKRWLRMQVGGKGRVKVKAKVKVKATAATDRGEQVVAGGGGPEWEGTATGDGGDDYDEEPEEEEPSQVLTANFTIFQLHHLISTHASLSPLSFCSFKGPGCSLDLR